MREMVVYVIRDTDAGGAVKIGVSNDAPARRTSLQNKMGMNLALEWVSKPLTNGWKVEKVAHALLESVKCNTYPEYQSEWFSATRDEAQAAILHAIKLCRKHGKSAVGVARGEIKPRKPIVYRRISSNVR